MYRFIIFTVATLFSTSLFAFNCYITFVKDSCWTNYNVVVKVLDSEANKVLTTVTIPKSTSWKRQQFQCKPGQKLFYSATFTPIFWQSEKGVSYLAKKYWYLPAKIEKNQLAWNLSVCFPKHFSEVPFPPDAEGNCKCDFKSIPPLDLSS